MARNLAALQAIEALRMHAAATAASCPPSLAEVTVVPVPRNPATRPAVPLSPRRCQRHRDARRARPSAARTPQHDGKRYVIKLQVVVQ